MPDEVTSSTTEAVTKSSDGSVKISVEKYDELLEKAATKPPVINRTTVVKTDEMLAQENLVWGNTLMGVGASLFVIGLYRRMQAS